MTFDMDGASDHVALAVPELVRLEVPALFFVPTGFLDSGDAVSSAGIQTLAESGMSVGSHSEWHRNLTTVEDDSLAESLARSRDTLQALSKQGVHTVAAPGGRYDDRVLQQARLAGFTAFFNSDPCYVGPPRSRFELCRIEIRGDRGPLAVDAAMRPSVVAWQATTWEVKRAVERFVGGRVWSMLSSLRRELRSG